jgi:3-oxoacyl-(acyl-carrier-protein) synthase/acyl carrier protein
VTVNWMPYFHDYGLVEGMLLPLFNRTLCVLMSPYALIKQPANWLRAISFYRATHSQAPNFAYALCVRRIDSDTLADLDLSHWRCAGNAAEPINPDAMAAFARTFESAGFRYESFCPGYGLAEATLIVTYKESGASPRVGVFDRAALERGRARVAAADASPQDTRQIVSCGRPLKDTVVVIVDPETRERAPAGDIGEIWVCSPAVAGGYWQREEASEETFRARVADTGEGPFLRTGDLGFVHEGELFVCGRLKDLIIIRGQNISPQDIEWTVQAAHAALKPESAAAFSVEVDGEERLVVAQEVQGKLVRGLDDSAAFAAIRSAVAEAEGVDVYAIALLRSGGIPKTSSGKIQRSACRRMFLDGTLNALATWRRPAESGPAAPRSVPSERPTETAIRDFVVARIAAASGQPAEAIDPREPFARFGFDSLRAVSLVGELESWLGRELPATLAFDYPNAAALARRLGADERTHLESVPSREGGGQAAQSGRQAIAIVGIGCRFPGGIGDPEQFWEALRAGVDGVREVPAERWDVDAWYAPGAAVPGRMNTRWGGFIEGADEFDAGFFAISPREARFMDPQQRILLEVSWEALEHAGIPADRLARSRTGVFVGICSNDYQRLQAGGESLQEGYAATGNALSIAANRISYALDLVGPSWAVDTACSSSLVAVHQACRSLLAGEADLALAGGVNLVLDPAGTVAFSQARMMSPTGRCRSFSDDADGYVRAEGCGMVVLKRLADATRDGDRVIAVIRGSAVNQDGRSNGLTAPSGPSQQAVVHRPRSATSKRTAPALRLAIPSSSTRSRKCWARAGRQRSAAGWARSRAISVTSRGPPESRA